MTFFGLDRFHKITNGDCLKGTEEEESTILADEMGMRKTIPATYLAQ